MGKAVKKIQCPICLDSSKDNLVVYEDGSTWCFACNESRQKDLGLLKGEVSVLQTRKLRQETCQFFNYQVGKFTGYFGKGDKTRKAEDEWVKIVNWEDEGGNVYAQKIKSTYKEMFLIGNTSKRGLYGKWKWSPNEKLFVTITEGEEDAMSVAQAQGFQYPVVSLPNGAGGAKRDLAKDLEWLLGFKYVVLAFDNDEIGKKAMIECASLFEPGRVRLANWEPYKDANEWLIQGKEREINDILFKARVWKPESIVTVSEILSEILTQPKFGMEYPWRSMTEITYGLQKGEINIVVGATGVGKTEFIKEIIFHFVNQGLPIGLFSFEQSPDNTMRRLIGAKLGVKLHIPGATWEEGRIKDIANEFNDKIYLYNRAGKVDTLELFRAIRYLSKANNVQLFIVDNIKALSIANDNEAAGEFMNALKALMKELNTTCFLLSHVAKDKFNYSTYVTTSPKHPEEYHALTAEEVTSRISKPGMEWESGRYPTLSNVEGSNIICALADHVFALARNTVSGDINESRTMKVKVLKDRLDSSHVGSIFQLYYGSDGRLIEVGNQYDKQTRAF